MEDLATQQQTEGLEDGLRELKTLAERITEHDGNPGHTGRSTRRNLAEGPIQR
jgi:hypothetical protein